MKITTQRNLLVVALLVSASAFGTCIAQERLCGPVDVTVEASPELLEAVAAACAAACPPAGKCPDCTLDCCTEPVDPPPPVNCDPVPPIVVPLDPPAGAANSFLLDFDLVPQLQGAHAAIGWKRWERPVWIKAGIMSLRLDELRESNDASVTRPGDYKWFSTPPPVLGTTRDTLYTVGVVWLLK
jgi:hypothetical protein